MTAPGAARGWPFALYCAYCAFLAGCICVVIAFMIATRDREALPAAIVFGVALSNYAAAAFLIWAHRTGWGYQSCGSVKEDHR